MGTRVPAACLLRQSGIVVAMALRRGTWLWKCGRLRLVHIDAWAWRRPLLTTAHCSSPHPACLQTINIPNPRVEAEVRGGSCAAAAGRGAAQAGCWVLGLGVRMGLSTRCPAAQRTPIPPLTQPHLPCPCSCPCSPAGALLQRQEHQAAVSGGFDPSCFADVPVYTARLLLWVVLG